MTKILLVDDERAASYLLKLSLELDGFDVVVCHHLQEARGCLTADIQAIILDYHLPQGQNGLTLLQDIRAGATRLADDIPVIVTSGDDRCDPAARAAGASLVLIKPYSPSLLSRHISRLVSENSHAS